jgi:hypothetical protein
MRGKKIMSIRLLAFAATSLLPLWVQAADLPKQGSDTFTAFWVLFMHYPTSKVVDGHGTAEFIGGTGKFAGITGTVEFIDTPG